MPWAVPGCGMQLETKKPHTVQLKGVRPPALGVMDWTRVKVELAGVLQSTSNSQTSIESSGGLPK